MCPRPSLPRPTMTDRVIVLTSRSIFCPSIQLPNVCVFSSHFEAICLASLQLKITTVEKSHMDMSLKEKSLKCDVLTGEVLESRWVELTDQCGLRALSYCWPLARRLTLHSKGPAKQGHIVAATFCPAVLSVRGKTWQHCCAPRGHKKCFWRFSETFCVQDTKFVSATNVARVAKRVNIWETWSRQQCCLV